MCMNYTQGINQAIDINNVNESMQTKPKERRLFYVEKVRRNDLINSYDKLFADMHDGIIADDINTTNQNSSNRNGYNLSDNNHNNSPTNFNKHNSVNMQAKYICHYPECFKEYKSKYNLKKHIKAHEGGQIFECLCEGCNKHYKIKENLDLHYKNYHLKVKPFTCGFCAKKFSHRNGKLYHEKKKHLNILQFRCLRGDCSAAYASRSALKYHLNHQHEKML